jgi:KDO2-lipid IV(A) lauroyltransferase
MTSRPRQLFDYGILYFLFLLARPLPRGFLLATGRGIGTFVWKVVGYRREVVLDNLRHAFGAEMDEEALRDLAHRFYRNLGMTLMEFLAFPRMKPEDFRELVDIEGREYFLDTVAEGSGALLVSGHFGNWEMMGARMAAEGQKVSFIVKEQTNARVDRIQNDIRHRAGIGTIRSGGAAIKDMVRALRRKELIGLVGDQDAGPDGYFTEFLGREASVFRGPAYFSWKLKVPIITGFMFRKADGHHVVEMDPPFSADPDWDEETAVARLTEIHTQRLEAAIRKAPEQYFWLHRRWKTRPPDKLTEGSTAD